MFYYNSRVCIRFPRDRIQRVTHKNILVENDFFTLFKQEIQGNGDKVRVIDDFDLKKN